MSEVLFTSKQFKIKGEAAKTSPALFCFASISPRKHLIVKILVSTLHNQGCIMGKQNKIMREMFLLPHPLLALLP